MRRSRKHRPDTSGRVTDVSTGTRHRCRPTLLASLLARLGKRGDQHLWTVRCRAGRGQQARLLVNVTRNGITITATVPGPWQLALPELDRLRDVLRDARLTLGLDASPEPTDPGRRIAPRRIVIREHPGGQGSSPEFTESPDPHQQPGALSRAGGW